MPDVPILAAQVQNAGGGYTVPQNIEVILKSVRAQVNGALAAGAFEPTLQIVAPGGVIVAEAVAAQVAAGASADVTWFPGVAAGGGAASGIQFNKDNEGGYFDITSNNTDPLLNGMTFTEKSGGGVVWIDDAGGGWFWKSLPAASSTASFFLDLFEGGGVSLGTHDALVHESASLQLNTALLLNSSTVGGGTRRACYINADSGTTLSFFGVAPVGRQATPATLAQVIALLQAYGLSA